MRKHLKLFNEHSEYETYLNSGQMILPNVSHCINENDVHYNPFVIKNVIVTYYVDDISQPTKISGYMNGGDFPSYYPLNDVEKIIIDNKIEILASDVERRTDTWNRKFEAIYQFESVGTHTIEYVVQPRTEYDMDNNPIEIIWCPQWLCDGCEQVVSAKLPEGITSLSSSMFGGCVNLTSINIPESVIGYQNACLFETNLSEINISKNVQYISEYALTGINPSTITVDPDNPYYDSRDNCNAIIETETNTLIVACDNTVIPQSVESFGEGAFADTGITSLVIPQGMTEIPSSLCAGCTELTSVTFNQNITSIGMSAFNGCTSLTSVTIPNSVRTIGRYAFYECRALQTLVIGTGITSIDYGAFNLCSALTSITCLATTPPSGGRFMFNNSTCPIYVPSASVNAYKTKDTNWRDYSSRIQAIP